MPLKWNYDHKPPYQLGGKGTDYGCWLVGRDEKAHAHVWVQLGQCGDEPEGDAPAKKRTDAILKGLNDAENETPVSS